MERPFILPPFHSFSAYFPLLDPLNGNLQPGQTIFVSAAAGAVGQLVCQIAKMIVGADGKVVASAGSADKCKWLKDEIGVDAVFNYKERDVGEALGGFLLCFSSITEATCVVLTRMAEKPTAELCPKGINVYYDNVGGTTLDATIPHMTMNGRIIACGSVSKCWSPTCSTDPASFHLIDSLIVFTDDGQMSSAGVPFKNMDQIVMKRLQMKGFIVGGSFRFCPHLCSM